MKRRNQGDNNHFFHILYFRFFGYFANSLIHLLVATELLKVTRFNIKTTNIPYMRENIFLLEKTLHNVPPEMEIFNYLF